MNILAIETSCDETAAAVVKDGREILSTVISSSQELHTKTGGIIPENAARQQVNSIIPVIQKALTGAFGKDAKENIDALAVTYGPGLIGSLLVGVETAKTLSYLWEKPLIPVNHLVSHIYANWLLKGKNPAFPALALVVSGGHTDLVFMKDHGDIKWIGGTRDDAAGEAFDKTARVLGLPYPGGPAISEKAKEFRSQNQSEKLDMFPRPLLNSKDFDFSFSGLKTSVLNRVKKEKLSQEKVEKYAAEIEEAIADVLVSKTLKAVEKFKPKSLLISGGVSANRRLRKMFESETGKQKLKVDLFIPPAELCTDNAAMIGTTAFYNKKEVDWKDLSANPALRIQDKNV